ncbi:hypothetical protein R1flu_024104 [Riccia fluitans]|uniref:Small auxin up regulated protein n=1 Tax=Riccia fluitans TaxID=41844 RepID=A0ABD1XTX4_9MARC
MEKIRQRRTSTMSAAATESMSDGESSNSKFLPKSKPGKFFPAFAKMKCSSISSVDHLPTSVVPKGSLSVYVGAERKRFIISTKYINHPLFEVLLKKSEEEFGFNHQSGLSISFDPQIFEVTNNRLEMDKLAQHHTEILRSMPSGRV